MAKKRGIHVTDVNDHELSIAETTISEEQTDLPESEIEPTSTVNITKRKTCIMHYSHITS